MKISNPRRVSGCGPVAARAVLMAAVLAAPPV